MRLFCAVFVQLLLLMPGGLVVAASPMEEQPKIDSHAHVYADIPEYVAMVSRLGFETINICDGGNDPDMMEKKRGWVQGLHKAHGNRFQFCPTFDLTQREAPGYSNHVIAYLNDAFDQGAVMVKMYKEVGLELKRGDGAYLMPDDACFDPIYAYLVKRGVPLLAHFAEPPAAWLPLDPASVHFGYYSRHPEWHFYNRENFPSYESILAARDRILEKHPALIMIGTHLGSMANDVGALGAYLDRFPNFHVDIAARTGDLSRQPRDTVRSFFIRYQDRVLYGSDLEIFPPDSGPFTPEQITKIVEGAERHYRMTWAYYTESGMVTIKGKEVECLDLPEAVVEKLYYGNAARIILDR